MSVLTPWDKTVVEAAIARSRTPKPRMTRTQALAPKRLPEREKRQPLLFVGLCSFCGAPALFGSVACAGHADLPELDAATSAVVTRNTNALGRNLMGERATEGRQGAV